MSRKCNVLYVKTLVGAPEGNKTLKRWVSVVLNRIFRKQWRALWTR